MNSLRRFDTNNTILISILYFQWISPENRSVPAPNPNHVASDHSTQLWVSPGLRVILFLCPLTSYIRYGEAGQDGPGPEADQGLW